MGMFDNLAQVEKERFFNEIQANAAGGADLPLTGGTLTGDTTINAGLAVASNASLSNVDIVSTSSAHNALQIYSPVGIATVAPLQMVASTASQSFFDFRGAVFSTASINLAANKVAGVVLVQFAIGGVNRTGYLPIFLGVS